MTKPRTVLVLLVVAAMAASVTPSLAKPNSGAFNHSSEGFKNGKQTASACKDLQDLYNQLRDQGTSKASREASEWKSSAKSFGCGWAN